MSNKMHDVYFGLGSNLGNKEENIQSAVDKINDKIGKLVSLSSFFRTDPVGFVSDNIFLNAACHVKTDLEPLKILEITKLIETELGRKTKSENKIYADRIIDIDMLMYDDIILQHSSLMLPHPHLHERDFVLLPLEEIAKNVVHPKLGKTIKELKEDLLSR